MELGGKDAAIVCADADIPAAAQHIVKGAFSYSGQRCTGAGMEAIHQLHCCVASRKACEALAGWLAGWQQCVLPCMHLNFRCAPPLFSATAVKLVLVEDGVADELVARILEGVKKLSVGM